MRPDAIHDPPTHKLVFWMIIYLYIAISIGSMFDGMCDVKENPP